MNRLSSIAKECLSSNCQDKVEEPFFAQLRERFSRFDQWCTQVIEAVPSHHRVAMLVKLGARWLNLCTALEDWSQSERARLKMVIELERLPSDDTLVPSLDAEHPKLNLGRRITLNRARQKVLLAKLDSLSRRKHTVGENIRRHAEHEWAKDLIRIRTEQMASPFIKWRKGIEQEIAWAEAVLADDDTLAESRRNEMDQWSFYRQSFEEYGPYLPEGYKTRQILEGGYHAGDCFSGERAAQWQKLVELTSGAMCFVVGCIHHREEAFILELFRQVCDRVEGPTPLLLVAPHASVLEEDVQEQCERNGLRCGVLSRVTTTSSQDLDVLYLDTRGLLKEAYSLGQSAIVGGTFLAARHHNYCEPLVWGKPVFTGYHQMDREQVRELVNEESPSLIRRIEPREADIIVDEWVGYCKRPQRADVQGKYQREFLRAITRIEPRLVESYRWLPKEYRYWIKELIETRAYQECPVLDELRYLGIVTLSGEVNPWSVEFLYHFEDPGFRLLAGGYPKE